MWMFKIENIKIPSFIEGYCVAVVKAATSCHANAFLFGSYALNLISTTPKSSNVIEFIIGYSDNFDKVKFWSELCKYIVVNKEIKNTPEEYFVVSEDFVLAFHLIHSFEYEKTKKFCSVNVDGLCYDLQNEFFIDPIAETISEPIKIESLIQINQWRLSDFIELVSKYADFENASIEDLSSIDIEKLRPSFESTQDLMIKILLSLFPGKCIKKICSVINGSKWLTNNLINLAIEYNIPIKEDISIDNFLNETKLKILDVYGEFFGSQKGIENIDQIQSRLSTNLRLLFETSNTDLHIPYIQNVKSRLRKWQVVEPIKYEKDLVPWLSVSGEAEVKEEVEFTKQEIVFPELYPPEYCDPDKCSPPCCCCKTTDLITSVGLQCHDKVAVSCNETGDGPGGGLDPFPPTCDLCRSVCRDIIADVAGLPPPGGITCTNLPDQPWWAYPGTSCECWCQFWKGAPNNSPCELTCVTCGDKCSSILNIEPSSVGECAFQLSAKPSSSCCGSPSYATVTFTIDDTGSMGGEIVSVRDGIQLVVEKLEESGTAPSFSLTTFKDDATIYWWKIDGTYGGSLTGSGTSLSNPEGTLDYTQNTANFKALVSSLSASGGGDWAENLYQGVLCSLNYAFQATPTGVLVVVTDAPAHGPGSIKECVDIAVGKGIKIFYIGPLGAAPPGSGGIGFNEQLATGTGGKYWQLTTSLDWTEVFEEISKSVIAFPSSCDCLGEEFVPIYRDLPECIDSETRLPKEDAPTYCTSIEIAKCYSGELCTGKCVLPYALYGCGSTIIIEPKEIGLKCCSDVGYGCDCEKVIDPAACCGPTDEANGFYCTDVCDPVSGEPLSWLTSVSLAQQYVWCECFDKAAYLDALPEDPNQICKNCCCPDETLEPGDIWYPCYLLREGLPEHPEWIDYLNNNQCCDTPREQKSHCCSLCVWLTDGSGGFKKYCKDVIDELTRLAYAGCKEPPIIVPDWECPSASVCPTTDECIIPGSSNRTCSSSRSGISSIKHPHTIILNNGVGLVAYENADGLGKYNIEIAQFKTSVKPKIISNRIFNYARLQNRSRWSSNPKVGGFRTVKLYYYEDIPSRFLTGTTTGVSGTWKDSVSFLSGPLRNQCFPLATVPGSSSPAGHDNIGRYLLFFVPSGLSLTQAFPSSDDVYNIQWFLVDKEDEGLIGSATDTTTPAKSFDLTVADVDAKLKGFTHLYNGLSVPIAYPKMAVAKNYQNTSENSHFVYLVYQAMEEGLWQVYLRQIRLSEYKKKEQIITDGNVATLVSLSDLGTEEVVYRIICVDDVCSEITSNFLITRTITMEVILPDGREVLNKDMPINQYWGQLCPGQSELDFPKRKVFVKLSQSAVTDTCPDQFEFDEIFYQWQVGEEYLVKTDVVTDEIVYLSLKRNDDYAVPLGVYSSPITKGKVSVYSSSISIAWYQEPKDEGVSKWHVMSDEPLDVLETYRGFDISEPILLTASESGHSTRPVVAVNYNNDVFVAYESIRSGIPQIVLKGTARPTTSLPIGVLTARNPDETLNPFLKSGDFSFSQQVTTSGMNQLPSIYCDFNDVIHLAWQSNRDTDWEIYATRSDHFFTNYRITKSSSKSLCPDITGDEFGNVFVVWHDNRFGNYEIMMAYQRESRILPFSQQDPYWAGVRNKYVHYQNSIPITLKSSHSHTVCLTRLVIYFDYDLHLSQNAFSIDLNSYPFAFEIPAEIQGSNTIITQEFTNISSWDVDPDFEEYVGTVYVSSEFDSGVDTGIYRINASFENSSASIFIAFRASNVSNDPQRDGQWSDWADISGSSGKWVYESSMGISHVHGRYKQVRFLITYIEPLPEIYSLTLESISSFKLCMNPDEEVIITLNLLPEIRVDQVGEEKTSVPLPKLFRQNNTYFVNPVGYDEDGSAYFLGVQKSTVSCFDCIRDTRSWNQISCSLFFQTLNEDRPRYLSFEIGFYADKQKIHEMYHISLTHNSPDLAYSSIYGNPEWDSRGMLIGLDSTLEISVYPPLSPETGLICGVKYYVEIIENAIDDEGDSTSRTILDTYWICDCNSERWNKFYPDITEIKEVYRWNSSAFGYNDTRLTESNGNNFKPVIRLRNNLQGIVLYQTDQSSKTGATEYTGSKFKANACAFNYMPDYNMYASGAQVIASPSGDIYPRSDISLLDSDNKHMYGDNLSFQIDMYDNLFVAIENPSLSSGSSQQFVRVHRCGLEHLNFGFDWTSPPEGPEPPPEPAPDTCVPRITCYASDEDPTIRHLVKKVTVHPKDVKYYVHKYDKQIPVVGKCDITLLIVGTPEMVALRIRMNSKEEWSKWFAFEPESGDNTIEFKLPNGFYLPVMSGLKHVYIQFATYTGLAVSVVYDIIADYDKVGYELNLYKAVSGITPSESVLSGEQAASIFTESNKLPIYDKRFPVAALPPYIEEDQLKFSTTSHLYLEIIPSEDYLNKLRNISPDLADAAPTFDFVYQGSQDQFNQPTYHVNIGGRDMFRSYLFYSQEDFAQWKDGLAYILVNFAADCSTTFLVDPSQTITSSDSPTAINTDGYNWILSKQESSSEEVVADINLVEQTDPWESERDQYGRIKYKVVLRSDDPYFVFGDPNYELKTNE